MKEMCMIGISRILFILECLIKGEKIMNNIKSPLNYTGNKYKLLPQILPLFPQHIDKFVDMFGGGGTVSANVNADKIICNDINRQLIKILQTITQEDIEDVLYGICGYINDYNLSKENQDGYIKLRNDYNLNKENWIMLYTLICYSFNNQIRFNSKNEYNMPFGKNRSSFNPTLENKFIEFTTEIQNPKYIFTNGSFVEFDFSDLDNNDFVYCDPPYFSSVATYNESGGWTEQNEQTLLNLLDELNNRNIRWALSNNLKYDNTLLDSWKDKYNIHYLGGDYSNCNYHKKDKSKDIEVLITNY